MCDTNHVLSSDYSEVIVVGAGADAVDYKLIIADIAPTLIELMGMEQPKEMTGKSLLIKK